MFFLRNLGAAIACAAAVALLFGCPQPIQVVCGGAGERCCEGSMCRPGNECAEDDTCRACGNDGQACCSGKVCSAGSECGSDTVCHACGAEGQPCCAQNVCQGSLRCDPGGCVTPCGDGCAPSAKRCNPTTGGVDLCSYSSPPCTAWSVLMANCPSGQYCDQGSCVDRCPDPCVIGSVLCTSEGPKVCVLDANQCQIYETPAPGSNVPPCATGACDGAFCWENPLPQGNRLVSLAGPEVMPDRFDVLDELGNVLRVDATQSTYLYRAPPAGTRLAALAPAATLNGAKLLAVGLAGAILTRSGGNWLTDVSGTTSVDFRGGSWRSPVRLAVGTGGAFYVGDEVSANWRALPSGTTANLNGAASYSNHGWAVGDGGVIIHCANVDQPAQVSCAPEATGWTTRNLNAISSTPSGEFYAVGEGGVILWRNHVGDWSQVASGVVGQNLRAVFALDEGLVLVAGDAGAFAHGAGDLFYAESFTDESLIGTYAADDAHVFAVGAEGTLWFNDAAGDAGPGPVSLWRAIGGNLPTRARFNAVAGAGVADVYAVGQGVLHRRGDSWATEAANLTTRELRAVTVVSPNEVYAFGDSGTILARRDGLWRSEGAGVTTNALHAAWQDGGNAYAVGTGGVWLEKPAGAPGTAWHTVSTGLSGTLRAMAGGALSGVEEVWAFGDGCAAVRRRGGSLSVQTLPTCAADVNAAAGLPDGKLYVGCADGIVYVRTAGVWDREYAMPGQAIQAMAVVGGDVWAAGESGAIYHRVAGNWSPEAERLFGGDFNGVWASPEGDVFLVGTRGILHRR